MSEFQDNFEISTGKVLTEAENHFNVSRMNDSFGALKVFIYTVMEHRQTGFCIEAFMIYEINSQYLMVWHIV